MKNQGWVLLVAIAFLLGGALGILLRPDGTDGQDLPKNAVRVAVLQWGTHPIIDSVRSGVTTRLRELLDTSVDITEFNGNLDQTTMRQAATQAVAGGFDVLIPITTPASQALVANHDGETPVVFTFVTDPSTLGYTRVGSLGPVTGLQDDVPYEIMVEALLSMVGKGSNIGYLKTKGEANAETIHREFERLTRAAGITLKVAEISGGGDVRQAAQTIAPNVDAFLIGGDHTVVSASDALLSVAIDFNKPVFSCESDAVKNGAVLGAAVDYDLMGRRTAEIAMMILGGAEPSRLPIEVFDDFAGYRNSAALQEHSMALPDNLKRQFSTELAP